MIAATEPEHAGRYSNTPDPVVVERAQDDGRAIVTDNVADYEAARLAHETTGEPHHGVVYALAPRSTVTAAIGGSARWFAPSTGSWTTTRRGTAERGALSAPGGRREVDGR